MTSRIVWEIYAGVRNYHIKTGRIEDLENSQIELLTGFNGHFFEEYIPHTVLSEARIEELGIKDITTSSPSVFLLPKYKTDRGEICGLITSPDTRNSPLGLTIIKEWESNLFGYPNCGQENYCKVCAKEKYATSCGVDMDEDGKIQIKIALGGNIKGPEIPKVLKDSYGEKLLCCTPYPSFDLSSLLNKRSYCRYMLRQMNFPEERIERVLDVSEMLAMIAGNVIRNCPEIQ
jgi:hypothetical protein